MMPSFNHQKRFAPLVESGAKRQTIRKKRRDGRNAKVGDTLYHFTGMQSPSCRRLLTSICLSVNQITIDAHGVNINGQWLSERDKDIFAVADGFEGFQDLVNFFLKYPNGLPFEGLLFKW